MGAGLTAYLKSEFSNWGKGETFWLFSASAVILGLSLYWGDSLLGIIAALTGVWCVVLTGMGKSVCFVFGIVNVLCYAYISYGAKYYGEVMLNTLYYFPMNFVGLYIWNKHTNKETGEVDKRHLNNKKRLVIALGSIVAIGIYGVILKYMGGNLPYIDSLTTILSITAQILTLYRVAEQWILWMVVNAATIFMWGVNFAQGNENIAVLLMWMVYFLNAVFMYYRWSKEAKNNEI